MFSLARGGTLLLDEIGEMDVALQVKLLRLLETGCYRRVGSTEQRRADFRLICATHRDLQQLTLAGKFRQDLYYRINVVPVFLPPLRERRDDILPLARYFLSHLQPKIGRPFDGFSREAENRLLTYSWPGNVSVKSPKGW